MNSEKTHEILGIEFQLFSQFDFDKIILSWRKMKISSHLENTELTFAVSGNREVNHFGNCNNSDFGIQDNAEKYM